MKVVVAPQAFKGTASATVVAEAMRRGVLRALPEAEVHLVPVADGGEGTVEALVGATGGCLRQSPAHDPLGRPLTATWGVLGDGQTAVIEVAAASGLPLLAPGERDPTRTTSRGTGELLRAALDAGYRRLLLGLGGSATNDAGLGLARALGVLPLDDEGRELPEGGAALLRLARLELGGRDPRLAESSIIALSDVSNPLCGPQGASAIYGPQKGATPQQVEKLERALRRFAEIVGRDLGRQVSTLPGGGAAGGLGAGLVALCNAELRHGFQVVSELLSLPALFAGADLVLTGEGRLDRQTAYGKAPAGVAKMAKECGVPLVVAIVGSLGPGAEDLHLHGFDALFSIAPVPEAIEDLAAATPGLVEAATAEVVRLAVAARR